MPAPEKVEPCAYCGSTEHATTTVGHRYIFPLPAPEKGYPYKVPKMLGPTTDGSKSATEAFCALPANESGCGCPLEVRYREALERIAHPENANPRVLELVTIAREALALRGD